MEQPVRTRIAPTPSGYLHIGNLYSFVLTWLVAKKRGGIVMLRIDDLDTDRMRPGYLDDIFRALEFIGLRPDEGPSGPADFLQNHSQLKRLENYRLLLERLRQSGALYACGCSRRQIKSLNGRAAYPGTCRNLGISLDLPGIAWRLALGTEFMITFYDSFRQSAIEVDLAAEMGDFVVMRKGGMPSYQLASLADDLHFGINLIVRGEDLTVSTAAQIKLAKWLGFSDFLGMQWLHHPLLPNKMGQKLSKSAGDTSIKWMVEQGLTAPQLLTRIGGLIMGGEIAISSLPELLDCFCSRFITNGS